MSFEGTFIDAIVASITMSTNETWTNPDRCPFCEGQLPSPGAGFVDHLDRNPDCESRFDVWRDRISDDICGGWSG